MAKAAASPPVRVPQPLGMYARELSDRAAEYLDAAKMLEIKSNERFLYVGYFLIAHAVELALKAWLAAKGVTKPELASRALGHDLRALHQRALSLGLADVHQLDLLVEALRDMSGGRDHALRYPAGRFLSVADADECCEVAAALLRATEGRISAASVRDALIFHSQYRGHVEWSD